MATLLLAEHDDAHLNPATARALTAALALGASVHVLVAGGNARAAAEAAAKLDSVAEVLLADSPLYSHCLAEPLAARIVALSGEHDAILAPSTAVGKNVLPRVAALLDVMQVSDIIKVLVPDTFERPIHAGNAIPTVRSGEAKKVITVRTASFAAIGEGGSAPIRSVEAAGDPALSQFKGEEIAQSDRPELASAAVDAGYAPNDWQVGQTARWSPRPRGRHFRRRPAPRRHEGQQGHCRGKQG